MNDDKLLCTDLAPSSRMREFLWPGPLLAQAIYVAADLDLAEHLKDESKTAEELALITGTHGPSLRRLLRSLAAIGVFREGTDERFSNTSLSETLRIDHPESTRAWTLFLNRPFVWKAFGALREAVETGESAISAVYGQSFWKYLAEHPNDAAVFNRAMSADSEAIIPFLLKAYDFSELGKIVDVGGGHGALLDAILAAYPAASAILYDLPAAVAGVTGSGGEVAGDRCQVRAGDFFESVPDGGDAYILKGIIHDWDDNDALRILKNCRRSIKGNGRLLIMEMILEASNNAPRGDFMDILMLVLTEGRERTKSDFRRLVAEAGFEMTRVIRTELPLSIIEARPV